MRIIWKGQSCFKILTSFSKNKQVSLIIDPFDETIGLRVPKMEADVLLISHDHRDHNNKKAIKGSSIRENTFLIDCPGEYDLEGMFIKGISAFHDDLEGKERGKITIFTVKTEGMRLCYLSDLGQKELTSEQLEKIGGVDILMIPIGGTYTISGKEAAKIVSRVEPKIVIPMHYQIPGLKTKSKLDDLDGFLKEMGVKSVEAQDKLLIKKKDLPEEKTEVVILKP